MSTLHELNRQRLLNEKSDSFNPPMTDADKARLVKLAHDHLQTNMVPSYATGQQFTHGARCMYRGERNGHVTKCIVGALIADEDYLPEMEGVNPNDSKVRAAVCKTMGWTGYPKDGLMFLVHLQEVHDFAVIGQVKYGKDFKTEAANQLAQFCQREKLEVPA